MQTKESIVRTRYLDWILSAALFVLTLIVYLSTLAPSVAYLFDDSLEFQLLASRMAIAHPTGYPLYSLLIKVATFLPFGDAAYRVNLVSALSGAGAVAFTYLAARLLTARFMTAHNALGEILTRVPAVIAALILAFGETFWSQAILAEVYALQALLTAFILWLVLRWGNSYSSRETRRPSLVPIAFFAGLMLTHHRLSVLLYPALALYVLTCERAFLKQPRTLLKIALAFLLPLLLYLYLPIRGTVTSSLDGAYQNTPEGFLNWILGTAYTVFLSQNPFKETRDAAYYIALFVNDISAWGLLVAFGGFIALFLRAWREWLLLALALIANLAFVLTYRVADINVFFTPTFIILALFVAAGLAGLLWLVYFALPNRAAASAAFIGAIFFLLIPLTLYREHYARVDLSNKTDVIAYGREVLSQSLPPNSTIIGILGEMSLLRYLQDTQNLRADIETIAADQEQDRLKAIDDAVKRNRTVFLTRPLKGIAQQYSLTSLGALIQLQPKPNRSEAPTPDHVLNADFGNMKLVGYTRGPDSERKANVTLYWQPQKKISDARLVSLKLLDPQAQLAGQIDRQPVLDAYPTNAWRPNEYIADSYNVPIFVGAAPGEYVLQVTMYDPDSGQVFGQSELDPVNVPVLSANVPRELMGVQNAIVQNFGDVELSGYDLDVSEPFSAGAQVPVTLLWRVLGNGGTREFDVTVADEFGKVVVTRGMDVGGATGQYVRQDLTVKLPNTLAAGKYIVRVTLRGGIPLSNNTLTLGILEARAQ